jgi:hypothetical protein
MKDEEPQPDENPPGPGRIAVAALRAVDAAIRALQKLRERIEVPAEDQEDARSRGRSGASMLDEAASAEAEEPRPKTLLHRALIVLMCVALGAAGGAWIAYRALSKRAVSQEKLIDFMRDDIEQSRKAEAVSLKARDKCFDDIAGYRQQTREAKQEIADCQSQVESLSQQVAEQAGAAPKRAERPASRPGPAPATPSPRTAPRSGTCVTGGTNAAGNLLDCIEKFNR